MNVIIVDDDPISRELLKICIERTESLKLVGSFQGVREAMAALKEDKNIDLILLDIEMPEISGIDFLNTLKDAPDVVVISSKKDYAVDAYNNDVIDYIVKPVNYDRFLKAINKVQGHTAETASNRNGHDTDFIFVRHKGRLQRVSMDDIEYAEANADYVNIVTQKERYVVHSSMKNIEAKFPSRKFVRAHRSFIINIDKANTIEENTLLLGDKSIPIGRLYKEQLLNRLNLI
jgi:two-component system LytT family response regulator